MMKRNGKKSLAVFLTVLLLGAILSGCGKKSVEIDVVNLGKDLLSGVQYKDELSEIDPEIASMIYNLEDVQIEKSAVYVSSGATAEEIAVFECKTEKDAGTLKTKLEERVKEQKDSFQDYVPEELDKLEKSVIIVSGKYAVLSISDEDSKAKDIIDKAFK